jgi:hypothetical protein
LGCKCVEPRVEFPDSGRQAALLLEEEVELLPQAWSHLGGRLPWVYRNSVDAERAFRGAGGNTPETQQTGESLSALTGFCEQLRR